MLYSIYFTFIPTKNHFVSNFFFTFRVTFFLCVVFYIKPLTRFYSVYILNCRNEDLLHIFITP